MAAALGVAIALGGTAAAAQPALLSLYPHVVRIQASRDSAGYGVGSGVAIGAERVATNCHVTAGAATVWVLRGDRRWRATAQAADGFHDVCLLEVPGLGTSPVTAADTAAVRTGSAAYAVGFPGGLGIRMATGAIVSSDAMDGGHVLRTDAAFHSGASGGGLFGDDGRLLGMLTFRLRNGPAHYFVVPVEWIVEAARRADAQRRWSSLGDPEAAPPPFDTPFWARPTAEQPAFLRDLVPEP